MTVLNAETRRELRQAVNERRRQSGGTRTGKTPAQLTPRDPWEESERYARRRSKAAARRLLEHGPADDEIAQLARRFRARCCPYSGLSSIELDAHALAAATAAVLARRRPTVPWLPGGKFSDSAGAPAGGLQQSPSRARRSSPLAESTGRIPGAEGRSEGRW